MTAVAEADIQRVAIVDDKPHDADYMGELVRDAGYEPIILPLPVGDLADMVAAIKNQADAVVCDHRLGGLAPFSGAEAVARLVESHIPAVLVTQYVDIDADVTIRQWRHRVPVLLSRDDADSDRIRQGLTACAREIRGEYLPGRRPWRTLIQIEGTAEDSGERVVEVRVFAWNPLEVVRFPASLVPPQLQERLKGRLTEGDCLFAKVNIGAERAEDLFFQDFEVAPDPVTEESLG